MARREIPLLTQEEVNSVRTPDIERIVRDQPKRDYVALPMSKRERWHQDELAGVRATFLACTGICFGLACGTCFYAQAKRSKCSPSLRQRRSLRRWTGFTALCDYHPSDYSFLSFRLSCPSLPVYGFTFPSWL